MIPKSGISGSSVCAFCFVAPTLNTEGILSGSIFSIKELPQYRMNFLLKNQGAFR